MAERSYLIREDPHRRKLREQAERRSAAMYREREAGATLQEIADRHGISRQRVHQIIYGPAPAPPIRPLSGPRRKASGGVTG